MDIPSTLPRILIVDESRMARALIIKNLSDQYSFREEGDGESAWQVLVLDSSIQLVICSLSLPVLDGDGLLVRVRSSRLPRISQMPMLMISGDNHEMIERVRLHGASDVISRETVAADWLPRIAALILHAKEGARPQESVDERVLNPETGLFTRKYVELQALQAMSHALRHRGQVSAMVMCFDQVDALREEQGVEALAQLEKRFAAILSSKIRQEDSLGHYIGNQLVVLSPGTPHPSCESFGNRLRKAIQEANIVVHGKRLNLSVSIGVSNSPVDEVASSGALIELAASRLSAAQQEGGNRVVGCAVKGSAVSALPSIERAIELITSGRENEVLPHLDALMNQALPLLKLFEQEFKLNLLSTDVEQESPDLAREDKDAGQN
ncbi:MAG: diguanylate cyclase [Betaproteobacteria bacterium]